MSKNRRLNKNGIPVLDPPKNGRKPNSNCPVCGYWNYDAKNKECTKCYINSTGKYAPIEEPIFGDPNLGYY